MTPRRMWTIVLVTLAIAGGAVTAPTGYTAQAASPNRIIGRVSVVGRCRTGDAECPTKYLRAIRVKLLDDEGATLAKRRTDSDGRFAFRDVEPGRYQVVARDVAGTRAPPAERVRVEEDSSRP